MQVGQPLGGQTSGWTNIVRSATFLPPNDGLAKRESLSIFLSLQQFNGAAAL